MECPNIEALEVSTAGKLALTTAGSSSVMYWYIRYFFFQLGAGGKVGRTRRKSIDKEDQKRGTKTNEHINFGDIPTRHRKRIQRMLGSTFLHW